MSYKENLSYCWFSTFTGQMTFLSLNEQCQITEGICYW